MASISSAAGGLRTIQFVDPVDRKRKSIRLGKASMRIAPKKWPMPAPEAIHRERVMLGGLGKGYGLGCHVRRRRAIPDHEASMAVQNIASKDPSHDPTPRS